MPIEKTKTPILVMLLSILGVLAIALFAGLLLMQRQEDTISQLSKALTFTDELLSADDFDPISWAREGAPYPPLQEDESPEILSTTFSGTNAIPQVEQAPPPPEPVVKKQAPIQKKITPTPKKKPRTVTEDAYWVQVFSSANQLRAEEIREQLTDQGMPIAVQSRQLNGSLRYRVRIGAFAHRNEAEYYASNMRKIEGFESSYVVLAPVTRQVEN